mgnify:CR=1 FL=1
MNILIYIIFLSFNLYPIGFDALNIPSNSMEMSLSGSGIAARYSGAINPSGNINQSSLIGFSANKWMVEINGNSFYYIDNGYQFTYSSFKVDDIELRNNIPSDTPLDIIESNLLSFGISKSFKIFKDFDFGIGTNFHYTQLFVDKFSTLTFDLGLQKPFLNNLRIGLLIKDIGINSLDIPTNYGTGISYYIENFKTEFLLDYLYSKHYNSGINFGLIQKIKMLTFNVGYSKFSNLRTTLSSGLKINLNKKYNFLYSVLSVENSNLGLAHYFGIEISL